MSSNESEVTTLTNPSNHSLVAKVLLCIGTTVIVETEDFGDDDFETTYKFPNKISDLGVGGDDAIGSLVGAFMDGDDLVLIANFGDDGNMKFNVVTERHLEIYKIISL